MSLRDMQDAIHAQATKNGWWDRPSTRVEIENLVIASKLALIQSEVSEALEEVRNGRLGAWYEDTSGEVWKPEGAVVELADVIIRCLDLLAYLGYDAETLIEDKHEYNLTRPHRHGGKRP